MNTKLTLLAIVVFSFTSAFAQDRQSVVSINPNPSDGRFQIGFDGMSDAKISIYNVLGEPVYAVRSSAMNPVPVDISKERSGVYIIKIESAGGTTTRKIVVR